MKRTLFLCACLLLSLPLLSQQRIKVMQYNLLQYGLQDPCAPALSSKDTWLRSIVSHYQPDIFTVNEMIPNIAYANRIKQLVFNFTNTIEYGELTNEANSNLANMIFYNTALLEYDATQSAVISNPVRDINVYALYERASALAGDTTYLYCIVGHLKAGQSTADATARGVAAESISAWIGTQGQGKNILLMGDMNLYGAYESAYQTLVFNSDTTRRLIDPTGLTNGWGGSANAIFMTQSTRSSASDCGSGGGMDDRFDFIFANPTLWRQEAGIRLVPGSYAAFGNDGLSYNAALNCSNNTPVPSGICNSLVQMSDHLPVILELDFDAATTSIAPLTSLPGIDLRLLGNPVSQYLDLAISVSSSLKSELSLSLFDMQGRPCLTQRLEAQSQHLRVSLPPMPAGLYTLRISDPSGRFIARRVQLFP